MKSKSNVILIISISLFLILGLVYPIFSLINTVSLSDFSNLLKNELFINSLKNSVLVSLVSTLISILLGYALAYTIKRSNVKHKKMLSVLFTLPMLIPSISHGIGIINLFGNKGLLSNLFDINIEIFGIFGIIMGSVMYTFPVAFFMLSDGFNYIDNQLYENAEVLGLSKIQQFKKITLVYLKKPIVSCVFAIFTMVFTDYGVALSIGGKFETAATFLYKEVLGLQQFSNGVIIGLILLLPALISFIYDYFSKEHQNKNFEIKKFTIKENKVRDLLLSLFSYSLVIYIILLLGSFLYLGVVENFPYNMTLSSNHIEFVLGDKLFVALRNSLFISLITALIGTLISYAIAYVNARTTFKLKKIFHLMTITSLAIPGIVLGIAYVMAFKTTFIYNTLIIIILVNIIHFMATCYLMAYNALGKLNINYEIIGDVSGISRIKIIKDVIIPNSLTTIYEMFEYFFINSMITISAVIFLYNATNMPISLLINQYESQLMLEAAALVSFIILLINIIVKFVFMFLKRRVKYGINI